MGHSALATVIALSVDNDGNIQVTEIPTIMVNEETGEMVVSSWIRRDTTSLSELLVYMSIGYYYKNKSPYDDPKIVDYNSDTAIRPTINEGDIINVDSINPTTDIETIDVEQIAEIIKILEGLPLGSDAQIQEYLDSASISGLTKYFLEGSELPLFIHRSLRLQDDINHTPLELETD